ncbi:MAG: SpoIID/LytB domain-containing protein [Gemmatimonadota bacterium]|nr:SpoIID/LytB domain-containing protein [Gemmatimonadota bacterium]
MGALRSWLFAAAAVGAAACGATLGRSSPAPRPTRLLDGGRALRVALFTTPKPIVIGGTGEWRLYDSGGDATLARGAAGESWEIRRDGGRMRAVRSDGIPTAARPGPFVARPMDAAALLTVNGHPYRGEITLVPTDSGVLVINRLPVESYLRGVVPLEIGKRQPAEHAAVEAQAVAARSYAYAHLKDDPRALFDLTGGVLDQVYNGAEAESPTTDAAVTGTRGLVLRFAGKVISAPYSSSCGGMTAAATEVWQGASDFPYLTAVSDKIPGSSRYYCDEAPRFNWTRTLERSDLNSALQKYLKAYVAVPLNGAGTVRSVDIEGRTPTGRVRAILVVTDHGQYTLRGNEMRFVLRSAGGEILNSTYFSVVAERDVDGYLRRLRIDGKGYGHGIGMCQWGAIGRARAGQDFRTILQTYYQGTSIDAID